VFLLGAHILRHVHALGQLRSMRRENVFFKLEGTNTPNIVIKVSLYNFTEHNILGWEGVGLFFTVIL